MRNFEPSLHHLLPSAIFHLAKRPAHTRDRPTHETMLANDYSYAQHAHVAHNGLVNGGYEPKLFVHDLQPQQHQHSGERPKLFALDMQPQTMGHVMGHHQDYHLMGHHGHQDLTPQHHHQHHQPQHHPNDFDHEPLMINMHHNTHAYYPPPGAGMLHVSSDYGSGSSVSGATPVSGGKRSREDLNMKEKKRMLKLNDRINELKDLLDEAGVQTKKNKQSILDNTSHYISMLRSNLLIAQQKAERAEKQAEMFRLQLMGNGSIENANDLIYKNCFQQSSTPRVVVSTSMELVAFNSAFIDHTGESDVSLNVKNTLRSCLCVDSGRLDRMVRKVIEHGTPMCAIVQARTVYRVTKITLAASLIMDEAGNAYQIEFSVIPLDDSSSDKEPPMKRLNLGASMGFSDEKETSPLGVEQLAM